MNLCFWINTNVLKKNIPGMLGRIVFTLQGGTTLTLWGKSIKVYDDEHHICVEFQNCFITHINDYCIFGDGCQIGEYIDEDKEGFDLSYETDEFGSLVNSINGTTAKLYFDEDKDIDDGLFIKVHSWAVI